MTPAPVAFNVQLPVLAQQREIQPVFYLSAPHDDEFAAKIQAGRFQRAAHHMF